MPFQLRDYQTHLADAGDAAMLQRQYPLLQSGTGTGKSVVLAELALRALARGERVVVICHRDTIHGHLVKALRYHLGPSEIIANIVSGSKPRLDRRVTVGMVPTMARRLHCLSAFKDCTLLIDEAHHLDMREKNSTTWQRVVQALQPKKYCGLSATPVRPDGKGLGDAGAFTVMIKGPPIAEMMRKGNLCKKYEIIASKHSISSKGMKKTRGDYSQSEMERKVVAINGHIVSDWLEFVPGRLPTICVAVSVKHAYEVAEMYRNAGVAAEAVEGTMPKEKSRAIFERFQSGKTTVLVACCMVDEGLDVPEAAVLQLTRNVDSIRLWKQLMGRVMRPATGKDCFYLLDHTDSWMKPHLGLPDQEVDWQLNSEMAEPIKRLKLVRNEETSRVEVEGEIVEVEVETTGARMERITPDLLAQAHPVVARRLLNERCRLEVEQRAPDLRRWLNYLDVLEDETLKVLEPALGLQPGWAQGQMMLRMLLSPAQRLAATKRLQRSWGGAI
jgi:superfamily II DNA or RNA helicase